MHHKSALKVFVVRFDSVFPHSLQMQTAACMETLGQQSQTCHVLSCRFLDGTIEHMNPMTTKPYKTVRMMKQSFDLHLTCFYLCPPGTPQRSHCSGLLDGKCLRGAALLQARCGCAAIWSRLPGTAGRGSADGLPPSSALSAG